MAAISRERLRFDFEFPLMRREFPAILRLIQNSTLPPQFAGRVTP
jgi:hypothetical protein